MGMLHAIAADHDHAFTPRGQGFLIGLVMAEPYQAGDVVAALRDGGVLSVPASENTVRLLPPLTITDAEIDILANALKKALSVVDGNRT